MLQLAQQAFDIADDLLTALDDLESRIGRPPWQDSTIDAIDMLQKLVLFEAVVDASPARLDRAHIGLPDDFVARFDEYSCASSRRIRADAPPAIDLADRLHHLRETRDADLEDALAKPRQLSRNIYESRKWRTASSIPFGFNIARAASAVRQVVAAVCALDPAYTIDFAEDDGPPLILHDADVAAVELLAGRPFDWTSFFCVFFDRLKRWYLCDGCAVTSCSADTCSNYLGSHGIVSIYTVIATFTLDRARDGLRDSMSGRAVLLVAPGSCDAGGLGHLALGSSMQGLCLTTRPVHVNQLDPSLDNAYVRAWASRMLTNILQTMAAEDADPTVQQLSTFGVNVFGRGDPALLQLVAGISLRVLRPRQFPS